MRRPGKWPVVWRWRVRFMAEGVEGLARDKKRKPGKQSQPTGIAQSGRADGSAISTAYPK